VTSETWQQISLLTAHHDEAGTHAHILKLTEEVGEAAAALIGINGWNKRKGVYATTGDLLDELGDVIITAAVAMTGITGSPAASEQCFQRHLAAVIERAGL
jgi:NTP pyrophosphatase (non-canonical NTP hydrolase)